jgi:hypothetical protein
VLCTRAAHDDRKDVDFGTSPVLTNGIGEGGVFFASHLRCVGEVVVRAIFPSPYMNIFNRGVTAATVCVADESRFEKPDKVGFVCRGCLEACLTNCAYYTYGEKLIVHDN